MEKISELIGKEVNVFDPHYSGDELTTLLELKSGDKKICIVGFDMHNRIIAVRQNQSNGRLEFDNTRCYGSYKGNGIVEGWCYDRDGYTIEGYSSSGYYKEKDSK